jgi:phage repressor protein C with HTH and peptisase S24 domain
MEPLYHEGDTVVFSPAVAARSGDDCFVRFEEDGGTTFKRVYFDDEQTLRLQPLNNKHPAETYNRRQVTGLWPAIFRIQQLRSM